MVRAAGQRSAGAARGYANVRVGLLIPTHALPPLSYRVPPHLRRRVERGSVVVAPLSGRSRMGIVLGEEPEPDRELEELVSVADNLFVPPDLLEVCHWVGESAAVPLSTVVRAALPPGVDTGRFVVARPAGDWPWSEGDAVSRTALKKTLGADGLKEAEEEGRVVLSPAVPPRKAVEWAVVRGEVEPDLARAPRQRELFDALKDAGGALPVAGLLAQREMPGWDPWTATRRWRSAGAAPPCGASRPRKSPRPWRPSRGPWWRRVSRSWFWRPR